MILCTGLHSASAKLVHHRAFWLGNSQALFYLENSSFHVNTQVLIKGGRGAAQSPVIFQLCFDNPWKQQALNLCGQHSLQSFASSLQSSAQYCEISGRDCWPDCPSPQELQWLGFLLQQQVEVPLAHVLQSMQEQDRLCLQFFLQSAWYAL